MSDCPAVLHHGPGHHSRARCYRSGAHSVHETVYSDGVDQVARWRGLEATTGFFDEPPHPVPDLDVNPGVPPAPLVACEVRVCTYYPDSYGSGEPDLEELPLAPGADPVREPAYLHREAVVSWLQHIADASDPGAEALAALETLLGPTA